MNRNLVKDDILPERNRRLAARGGEEIAGDEVAVTDEFGHEAGGGVSVKLRPRTDLVNHAF
ncbi:hypothetical protein D3C80_1839680 [compost metagenome]